MMRSSSAEKTLSELISASNSREQASFFAYQPPQIEKIKTHESGNFEANLNQDLFWYPVNEPKTACSPIHGPDLISQYCALNRKSIRQKDFCGPGIGVLRYRANDGQSRCFMH